MAQAEAAISESADAVRQALSPSRSANAGQPQPNTGQPTESDSPLTPQQMAQMLDELDRQLNGQSSLGAQDNNQPGQAGNSAQPAPSTLAEAARRLAASMSQSRQPTAPNANADIGMATEGQLADVNPQPPVPVRILDLERLDGEWGALREQSAEEMIETRRDALSAQVRRQVEAYFRVLSEKSQKAEAK